MNTLPQDLTGLITKHELITESILLGYDCSDYHEYLNLSSIDKKLKLAIANKHYGWINYCIENNHGWGWGKQTVLDYHIQYDKGKRGIWDRNNVQKNGTRVYYLQGICEGQHKDLYLKYLNEYDLDIEIANSMLIYFNDEDFIIEHMDVSSYIAMCAIAEKRYRVLDAILSKSEVFFDKLMICRLIMHNELSYITRAKININAGKHSYKLYMTLAFMKLNFTFFMNVPDFYDELPTKYFLASKTIRDKLGKAYHLDDESLDVFINQISDYIYFEAYLEIERPNYVNGILRYLGDNIQGNQTDWDINTVVEPIVNNIVLSSIGYHINNSTVDAIRRVFVICLEYYGFRKFEQMLDSVRRVQNVEQSFYIEMVRLIKLNVKDLKIEAKRLKIEGVDKMKKMELFKNFIMSVY